MPPIYHAKVTVGSFEQDRLIDAKTAAGALRHLAKQLITVEQVRTTEQIKATAELAANGVKVEVATDE